MPNILFWPDINYEPGHWRPVMAMADKVRNKLGYNVEFLCTPECEPIINTGYSPGLPYTPVLNDLYKIGYSSLVLEKPEEAVSRIEHCLRIAEKETGLYDAMDAFKPDLLVAGYFIAMEALLIQYKYNNTHTKKMKLAITTTFLRHPSEDPEITSLRFLAHHAPEVGSRLMQAATEDDEYNGSFASIRQFVKPLSDVYELITCPQSLDHPEFRHREKTVYVEPSILDDSGNPTKNPILIYASAGSRVRDYVESARTLFQILIEMLSLSSASGRKLEMAVGYTLKEAFAPFTSSRVKIIDWANQADSLKRARSAVVHGGLATIKECIYFGIPPIVVPFGKDQMDNALRVVNKKVGSLVMLDSLNAVRLHEAILEAEKKTNITDNIQTMKEEFVQLETRAPSLEIIRELVE